MTYYTVTGIFVTTMDAEDPREARSQAEYKLKQAGFKGCVVEVREEEEHAQTKQKRPKQGATKTPEAILQSGDHRMAEKGTG